MPNSKLQGNKQITRYKFQETNKLQSFSVILNLFQDPEMPKRVRHDREGENKLY